MSRPATEAQFCTGCGHRVFVEGGCEDPDGCSMEIGVGSTPEFDKPSGESYEAGDYKKYPRNELFWVCGCGKQGCIEEKYCGHCGTLKLISEIRKRHGLPHVITSHNNP